jgi:hypothetical protein
MDARDQGDGTVRRGLSVLAVCITVALGGCTASSTRPAEPAARASAPAGWKEVRYQGLSLSVPQDWEVLDVQRSCRVAGPAVLLGGVMPLCPVPARQRDTLVRIYPPLRPGAGQGKATGELNGARVRMHGTVGGSYGAGLLHSIVVEFVDLHVVLQVNELSGTRTTAAILATAHAG